MKEEKSCLYALSFYPSSFNLHPLIFHLYRSATIGSTFASRRAPLIQFTPSPDPSAKASGQRADHPMAQCRGRSCPWYPGFVELVGDNTRRRRLSTHSSPERSWGPASIKRGSMLKTEITLQFALCRVRKPFLLSSSAMRDNGLSRTICSIINKRACFSMGFSSKCRQS